MKKIKQFEKNHRNKLVWIVRFMIAFLFIVSAAGKLMPIEFFEKQLVGIAVKPGILFEFTNWCTATIWARVIIIMELFLGLSLLIPFFQRKFTIPLSISMLIMFIAHLSFQIAIFGNSGNCGCMGELIPMSPLSAIIKNIFTIIILIYLFFAAKKYSNENPVFHFLLFPAVALGIFVFFPIKKSCCCEKEIDDRVNAEVIILNKRIDTLLNVLNSRNASDTAIRFIPVQKSIISEFHKYKEFELNGGRIHLNIDEGKSIVCVFNSDCSHCLDLAKKLNTISKNMKLAKIHFLFFNNDAPDKSTIRLQISEFLKNSKMNVPFKIINLESFNHLLINAPAPPRLVILENGKILYDYVNKGDVDFNKIKRLGGN